LKELLFEHLAEEETVVPPLLKDNFTFEENMAIIGKIIADQGPD